MHNAQCIMHNDLLQPNIQHAWLNVTKGQTNASRSKTVTLGLSLSHSSPSPSFSKIRKSTKENDYKTFSNLNLYDIVYAN